MNTIHIANNHDKKLPMDNKDAVRQLQTKSALVSSNRSFDSRCSGSHQITAHLSKLSGCHDQRTPPFQPFIRPEALRCSALRMNSS